MLLSLLLACPLGADSDADAKVDGGGDADDTAVEQDSGGDSGDPIDPRIELEPAECPPSNDYTPLPPHDARVLTGEGVWHLDFDAVAEALGYADCSYTRVYGDLVEREGHQWQCPECDYFTTGEGTVVEGYEDCTSLISSSEATRTEHLGLGMVDGVPHFFRTSSENLVLGDLGELTGSGTDADPYVANISSESTLSSGGSFVLTAQATFTERTDSSIQIHDPNAARTDPYACGWMQCNPGGPASTWALSTGGVFPNAVLTDSCGDDVNLWDFSGRYLVLDASSPDCGPCINLAKEESAWVASMAARGIEVEWITLLNASLGHINEPATDEQMEAWISGTGTTGVVLADEGLGYSLFPAYTGQEDGMSFPTMIVVSPDMTILGWDSGFASEASGGDGFSVIEALIVEDR